MKTYRELQIECKRLGLSGSGSRTVLEARLATTDMASPLPAPPLMTATTPTVKMTHGRPKSPKFVFVGNGYDDPDFCVFRGYRFKLNGAGVTVGLPDVIAKLENNPHFKRQ